MPVSTVLLPPAAMFLLVAAGLYGLVIGSFLNVVIHRVPLGLSVVRPPSACPGCGHRISARENVPVLSWLFQRGRCRGCAMRIPARYPLVEAITAAVFVAVALRFGWSWSLPAEIVFVAGLVALAWIDLDHYLLPRKVIYPLGAAVAVLLSVAAAATGEWHRLLVAALCGVVEFAALFSVHFASPRSLGFGDVRFGPVIGLALGWLGWQAAFVGFLAANLIGTIVGVVIIATRRGSMRTRVPYGVFLAAGAVAALLAGGAVALPA